MGIGPGDHDTSGSIRSAGGSFAKMEVAHEEEYFYKLVRLRHRCHKLSITNANSLQRREQLEKLKAKATHELEFREKAIKDHEDAIQRHKAAIDELRKSN